MLKQLGFSSLDDLTNTAVPDDIKLNRDLILDEPLSEYELIKRIKSIADKNNVSETLFVLKPMSQFLFMNEPLSHNQVQKKRNLHSGHKVLLPI